MTILMVMFLLETSLFLKKLDKVLNNVIGDVGASSVGYRLGNLSFVTFLRLDLRNFGVG